MADDAGNLPRSAKGLKMALLPADGDPSASEIEQLVISLINAGFYDPYRGPGPDGKEYLHIAGFENTQRPDHPTAPKHPLFPGQKYTFHVREERSWATRTVERGPENVPRTAGERSGNVLAGEERKGEEGKETSSSAPVGSDPDKEDISRGSNGNGRTKASSAEAIQLAGLLGDLILKNNSGNRELQETRHRGTIERWAIDIERLLRLDKRSAHEVEDVIRASQADPFWSTNILSGAALRKQFDRLVLIQRKGEPHGRRDAENRGPAAASGGGKGGGKYADWERAAKII